MNRLTDPILAVFFAVIVLGYVGHALDRWDTVSHAQQAAAAEARAEAQQARLKRALQELCGENGHAEQVDSFTYRCVTKRGQRSNVTARVQL